MTTTATTTAKKTARSVRVWIEGKRLTDHGFTWHRDYTIKYNPKSIQIVLGNSMGMLAGGGVTRQVAGRTRNGKDLPIIDLHSKELEAVFSAGDLVKVTYRQGEIFFTKA